MVSNRMKMRGLVIAFVLLFSTMSFSSSVLGKTACPPGIDYPNPVLFEVTPYSSGDGLVLGVDVYSFYQPYEGMCPISSVTDELDCLSADALDFSVHYNVTGNNVTGELGRPSGVQLETYLLNVTNDTVVIDVNGSRISLPFGLLREYLSSLNISGMLADHIYSDSDNWFFIKDFNLTGVVRRMRAFSYEGRLYLYFPQVQLVDCRYFIPERFYSGGRYVSPIIPMEFNGSVPIIPPLVLEYSNGSLRPVLRVEPVKKKGEWGYYYECGLPNLRLPGTVKPPLQLWDGRNYSYVYIAPEKVEVSINGFTNGTFALLLMNLTVEGILIPGAPQEHASMRYTLLFGYNGRPFQIDLKPILKQFNPPEEDEYGNPAFHFSGVDDGVFSLGVAFINGKPYIGVEERGSENVTMIRLYPEKNEWMANGTVSLKRWDELVAGSPRGKSLENVSAYAKYFLSVPRLDYVPANGGTFVYPERYAVSSSGLPSGYARVGNRIIPLCSIWPVYAFSANGTAYGLFLAGDNFTIYPPLVEYHKARPETTPKPETTPTSSPTEQTAPEKGESICGPGIVALMALLALGFRER
ncbi:hypothetical protein [Thermococcus sp.]|uniref:hypothetical protein n=1 Tax=Thermococcus sp. TaxID=35749 RepID=UPI0025D7CE12|nr:hypothetical protein [Thermococcus sp.]